MKDIQSLPDLRRISIRKVGVKNITYPIIVLDKERKTQQTVARVNMYVNLPHRFKGTHMSRFVEILNRFHGKFNLRAFHRILEEMKVRLEAEAAHLEIAFPYFLHGRAQGATPGLERYECRLHGSLADRLDLVVEVDVPVALRTGLATRRGPGAGRYLGHGHGGGAHEPLPVDRGPDRPHRRGRGRAPGSGRPGGIHVPAGRLRAGRQRRLRPVQSCCEKHSQRVCSVCLQRVARTGRNRCHSLILAAFADRALLPDKPNWNRLRCMSFF